MDIVIIGMSAYGTALWVVVFVMDFIVQFIFRKRYSVRQYLGVYLIGQVTIPLVVWLMLV